MARKMGDDPSYNIRKTNRVNSCNLLQISEGMVP